MKTKRTTFYSQDLENELQRRHEAGVQVSDIMSHGSLVPGVEA